MTLVKDKKIAEACNILFGESFSVENATLEYLQLSGIKHAFREKAKECHPDMYRESGDELQENFLKLKDAYDFLISVKSNHVDPQDKTVRSTVSIPNRKLRLGEFLYYTGKISWKDLISAITWQRQNNNKNKTLLFGLFFIKQGILSTSELGFSVFKMNIHNSNY